MGDHYDLVMLGGKFYIDGQSQLTEWQPKAVDITPEQLRKFEEMESKHHQERQKLLKSMFEENVK